MKNIKWLLSLMVILFITTTSFAQTIHNAKVIGVIAIGQKDIAMILDETTQEMYKTTVYNRGLLVTEESIELEMKPNDKAEIKKPNLNANIIAFKEHNPQGNNDNNVQSFNGDIYKYIGEQHNVGLDYVYEKLVLAKANGVDLKDKDALLTIITAYTSEFIDSKTIFDSSDGLKTLMTDIGQLEIEQPIVKLYRDSDVDQLTEFELQSLDLMNSMLSDESKLYTSKNINYLDDMWRKNCVTNPNNEYNLLLIATNVGDNSFHYWSEEANMLKWRVLFDVESDGSSRRDPIKDAVGADVAGGITGALGGSFVPGVGTLAGGLGGACLSSMASLISSWW